MTAGRPRPLPWLAVAALAVLAVIAADNGRDDQTADAPLDPGQLRPGFGPRTYVDALARAEQAIEGARAHVARNPGEWLPMEVLARALMARFRLAASPEDLAEADRLLTDALYAAPYPAGPSLSRAAVALMGHDLQSAESALARLEASVVPPNDAEQLDARSIRCEIAFQRGRLAEAERLCSGNGDLGLRQRLANIAAKRGGTAAAANQIEALMRRTGLPPSTLAQLSLQRASVALAEGDWEASGRWALAAERVFPGYWLTDAFLAQQKALEGRTDEARRRFAALAARTGNPDVMDALAALAKANGAEAEVQRWIAKAGVAWGARMALSPRAYLAHFAEHTLAFGEPESAAVVTGYDYGRRPFSTPAVNHARALLGVGRASEALNALRATERRGFRTAAMKIEEYHALMALRRPDQARIARQQAYALNPKIEDPRQRFVFFDQD